MSSPLDKDAPPIEAELWAERAAALSRTTERFESRLRHYQACSALWQDIPPAERTIAAQAEHDHLEAEAAQALWYLVVQREALGLRSHTDLFEVYAVPPNVRRKMGPMRPVAAPHVPLG